MAEVALRQKISLAPDAIGSGEKVLRLTVNEDTAQRLRELSGGGMALAWRRLFSTVAEHTGVVARRVTSPSPRAALPAPRVSGDGGWWIGSGPLQKAKDPIRRDSSVFETARAAVGQSTTPRQ
jgi:hypothetical protein